MITAIRVYNVLFLFPPHPIWIPFSSTYSSIESAPYHHQMSQYLRERYEILVQGDGWMEEEH